jgi:hypothetical protein
LNYFHKNSGTAAAINTQKAKFNKTLYFKGVFFVFLIWAICRFLSHSRFKNLFFIKKYIAVPVFAL